MSDFWDEMSVERLRDEVRILHSRETLEDRFAMAALTGLLAGSEDFQQQSPKDMANDIYGIARACTAERSKK